MAGPDPTGAFVGEDFRRTIRAAMVMGMPEAVEDRPMFHFADGRTFAPDDSAGEPYDWTVTAGGLPTRDPVHVTCVVDSASSRAALHIANLESAAGELNPGSAFLYLFEDEWAEVHDFTSVVLGEITYYRVARLNPLGLFDVQIEVIEVRASEVA